MKVYRLQHRVSGKGPYFAQGALNFNLDQVCVNMNSRNCPEPDNDVMLRVNFNARFPHCYRVSGNIGDFIFGFTDEAQLKKWFGSAGIMRLIRDYDFEVAVKEISGRFVIKGETQCMVDTTVWFETETTEWWTPSSPTRIAVA